MLKHAFEGAYLLITHSAVIIYKLHSIKFLHKNKKQLTFIKKIIIGIKHQTGIKLTTINEGFVKLKIIFR